MVSQSFTCVSHAQSTAVLPLSPSSFTVRHTHFSLRSSRMCAATPPHPPRSDVCPPRGRLSSGQLLPQRRCGWAGQRSPCGPLHQRVVQRQQSSAGECHYVTGAALYGPALCFVNSPCVDQPRPLSGFLMVLEKPNRSSFTFTFTFTFTYTLTLTFTRAHPPNPLHCPGPTVVPQWSLRHRRTAVCWLPSGGPV